MARTTDGKCSSLVTWDMTPLLGSPGYILPNQFPANAGASGIGGISVSPAISVTHSSVLRNEVFDVNIWSLGLIYGILVKPEGYDIQEIGIDDLMLPGLHFYETQLFWKDEVGVDPRSSRGFPWE